MPGTYTFTENNITLLQALGLAGDLTIDGNRQDIILIRVADGKRITTKLDLTSASWLNSTYQNIKPNDVIIVNPNTKKMKNRKFFECVAILLKTRGPNGCTFTVVF